MCIRDSTFARFNRQDAFQRLIDATYFQRTWGDAYGYALVATGRAEIMLDPVMALWDCGPLQVILEEAGGTTLQANGVLDTGEPGIPGVTINLFAGDCTAAAPGDEIVTTTDESGAFRFEDLSPDTYCVFLDTATEANLAVLEEGTITFPLSNGVPTNSITVTLEEGCLLYTSRCV